MALVAKSAFDFDSDPEYCRVRMIVLMAVGPIMCFASDQAPLGIIIVSGVFLNLGKSYLPT
jgi:hypothetical protein